MTGRRARDEHVIAEIDVRIPPPLLETLPSPAERSHRAKQAPVPVGTFSGKPLSSTLEPPVPKRTAGISHPHPTFKQSTTTLANDNVEAFWQGAKRDHRIIKDVLNRTKARDNKAASTGSHIKMDCFQQTKRAPGSHAKVPGPYVSQYNSKFNMQTAHHEKRGLIAEKAKQHQGTHHRAERPVSASEHASANKLKSRMASVRLYQES